MNNKRQLCACCSPAPPPPPPAPNPHSVNKRRGTRSPQPKYSAHPTKWPRRCRGREALRELHHNPLQETSKVAIDEQWTKPPADTAAHCPADETLSSQLPFAPAAQHNHCRGTPQSQGCSADVVALVMSSGAESHARVPANVIYPGAPKSECWSLIRGCGHCVCQRTSLQSELST